MNIAHTCTCIYSLILRYSRFYGTVYSCAISINFRRHISNLITTVPQDPTIHTNKSIMQIPYNTICIHELSKNFVFIFFRQRYTLYIYKEVFKEWKLKIPKRQSESVNQRTDNTIVKRKNPQNTTQKTKDRITRTPLKTTGEHRYPRRVSSSCFTSGSCSVTLATNQVIKVYI